MGSLAAVSTLLSAKVIDKAHKSIFISALVRGADPEHVFAKEQQ